MIILIIYLINTINGDFVCCILHKIMLISHFLFQEGQGLGKKEQGMSVALQVEKTSKRGGRIIHEKDSNVMPPPGFTMSALPGSGIIFLSIQNIIFDQAFLL